MAVVVNIPGCGGQLMLFRCNHRDDFLELTPITWEGLQEKETTIWELSSAGKVTDNSP